MYDHKNSIPLIPFLIFVFLALTFLAVAFFSINFVFADTLNVIVTTAGTTIQNNNIDPTPVSPSPFTPVLGSTLNRSTDAYYGVNTVSTVDVSDVHWRIIVERADGQPLTDSSIINITEQGWFDAFGHSPNTPETPTDLPYYLFTSNGSALIGDGNSGWSVANGDNFTDVDLIRFFNNAPLTTYNITRELIQTADNSTLSNPYQFQVTVTPSVYLSTVDSSVNSTSTSNSIVNSFTPQLGAHVTSNTDVYYGTKAVSIADTSIHNVVWKITIHGPNTLNPSMVNVQEVGWYDTIECGILASIGGCANTAGDNYTFSTDVNGNLVALGSGGTFDIDTTDNFATVSRIHFNTNAPLGTYTITYQIVGKDVNVDHVDNESFDGSTYSGFSEVNVTDPLETTIILDPTPPTNAPGSGGVIVEPTTTTPTTTTTTIATPTVSPPTQTTTTTTTSATQTTTTTPTQTTTATAAPTNPITGFLALPSVQYSVVIMVAIIIVFALWQFVLKKPSAPTQQ